MTNWKTNRNSHNSYQNGNFIAILKYLFISWHVSPKNFQANLHQTRCFFKQKSPFRITSPAVSTNLDSYRGSFCTIGWISFSLATMSCFNCTKFAPKSWYGKCSKNTHSYHVCIHNIMHLKIYVQTYLTYIYISIKYINIYICIYIYCMLIQSESTISRVNPGKQISKPAPSW